MGTATTVVQQAYEAFARGDVPAILNIVADDVDWEFVGSPALSYAGKRRNRKEVADFFTALSRADGSYFRAARAFIDAGEHVTVFRLGKINGARNGNTEFLVQNGAILFTVKNDKVTRWRGFFNTAARYSY